MANDDLRDKLVTYMQDTYALENQIEDVPRLPDSRARYVARSLVCFLSVTGGAMLSARMKVM